MVLENSPYQGSHAQLNTTLEYSPLPDLLKNYTLSLKVDEKSNDTINVYRQRISGFVNYCKTNQLPACVADLTNYHVRLFLQSLRDRGIKSSTVNAYYRCLHTFFTWLINEGVTKNFPMNNIKPPRIDRTIIKPFSLEDVKAVLNTCSGSHFLDIRNRAIVLLMLDTCLRLSEVTSIQLKDVDIDHETITVMGKGHKERTVRIGKVVQKAILKYLLARGGDKLPYLWLTEEHTPLSKRGLQVTIDRLCDRAKITDARPSPHTLRHTGAINFLRNGGGEFSLQLLLGHSTLYMTRRYVGTLGTEDMFRAHQKASPVDNLKL